MTKIREEFEMLTNYAKYESKRAFKIVSVSLMIILFFIGLLGTFVIIVS